MQSPVQTPIILLVEDHSTVRKLLCKILSDHGYTVLEASQGEEALGICRQHPGPIHLLLTDVSMPGMDGQDLAEQVLSLRPHIQVLYMSAHPGRSLPLPDTAFIQKPFTADILLQRVRAVLDPLL